MPFAWPLPVLLASAEGEAIDADGGVAGGWGWVWGKGAGFVSPGGAGFVSPGGAGLVWPGEPGDL